MNNHDELLEAGLVDITKYCKGVVCDIRYASIDNLTGEKLYESASCYLRREVADAVNRVQASLDADGVSLKIWDAYRPISVQNKLVSFVNNTNYTPNVSNHSRGIALDVTLVNKSTGQELEMPTEHDDLTEAAHQDADVQDKTILNNRETLKAAMRKEGFTVYPYEWWHYDYLRLADAEPLDITI